MVDLRAEMNSMLRENGNPILLVRNDRTQPCSCINKLYNSPKTDCPICLGTGYINSVEKILSRQWDQGSINQMKTLQVDGVLVNPVTFFFEYTVEPKKSDLIVTCGWNGEIPIIDAYTNIYIIDNAIPMRGDAGRIEFFKCITETSPVQQTVKLHNMVKNANEIKYYITVK